MPVHAAPPGILQYAIPIAIFLAVFALRARRLTRLRPLKVEQLWIVPAIFTAVVAIIFFWPVAIPAFNHALKVHPLWMMGDVQGAQYSSNRAAFFGKLSLGIFFVLIVLYFAFIALVVANSY